MNPAPAGLPGSHCLHQKEYELRRRAGGRGTVRPGLVAISLENQFGRDWAAKTGITEDGLVRFAMAALLDYLR